MYPITQRFETLTTEQQKQQFYKDMTVHQDKLPLIRFADNKIITNLLDLVTAFFYTKLVTFNVKDNDKRSDVIPTRNYTFVKDVNCQCSSGRRRSLLDFYLIQKYYLANPMNMERCANIYFNKLERGWKSVNKAYKDMFDKYPGSYRQYATEELRRKEFDRGFTNYYCTGVQRNVFWLNGHDPIQLKKNLFPYRFKMKSNEEVQIN